LENDNFKTALMSSSSVSTEWIVLVCFKKYVVIIAIKRSLRTGNQCRIYL